MFSSRTACFFLLLRFPAFVTGTDGVRVRKRYSGDNVRRHVLCMADLAAFFFCLLRVIVAASFFGQMRDLTSCRTRPTNIVVSWPKFIWSRVSRFRKRYSGEYEGMSTADLAGDLRRDVEHYRGLWRTARTADAKVCIQPSPTSTAL